MTNSWIVFKKELIDALRDRRTLMVVLLSSVAIGPLVLVALSALVAGAMYRGQLNSSRARSCRRRAA